MWVVLHQVHLVHQKLAVACRAVLEHLLMPSKVAPVATTSGTENNGIDKMKTPEIPSYIRHSLWI
jgi:hypothetical protein